MQNDITLVVILQRVKLLTEPLSHVHITRSRPDLHIPSHSHMPLLLSPSPKHDNHIKGKMRVSVKAGL